MLRYLSLPKKALLGITAVTVVGFVLAIVDGYELSKERGYLRGQKYEVHNPLNVFGFIVTRRDNNFIKSNISKFKEVFNFHGLPQRLITFFKRSLLVIRTQIDNNGGFCLQPPNRHQKHWTTSSATF